MLIDVEELDFEEMVINGDWMDDGMIVLIGCAEAKSSNSPLSTPSNASSTGDRIGLR